MTAPKVQQVFIVAGLRRIREVPAQIHVCEKMTWARWPAHCPRKSSLLGTSAFFTRKAAEVRKLGELRKLAARPVLPAHLGGNVTLGAREQLAIIAAGGPVH